MRKISVVLVALLSACSSQPNPLALPLSGLTTAWGNATNAQTRGEVEVFVKTNHPELLQDIARGGGPSLSQAYDLAKVPQSARALHTLRLQSDRALYQANPGALVVAIMVVAGE